MAKVETIIVVHIPRTGGLQLYYRVLEQWPEAERDVRIYHIRHEDLHNSWAKLLMMDDKDRREIRVVRGHMPFGIHRILQQHCTYATILREPVDRVVSLYYYVVGNHPPPIPVTLKQFVFDGLTGMSSNDQVRMLHGEDMWCTRPVHPFWQIGYDRVLPFEGVTREHLKRAKHNLRARFSVVGLRERYADTVRLLNHTYGWNINVKKLHPNYNTALCGRPKLSEVPLSIREEIRRRNELDIELYELGKQLFKEQYEAAFGAQR